MNPFPCYNKDSLQRKEVKLMLEVYFEIMFKLLLWEVLLAPVLVILILLWARKK